MTTHEEELRKYFDEKKEAAHKGYAVLYNKEKECTYDYRCYQISFHYKTRFYLKNSDTEYHDFDDLSIPKTLHDEFKEFGDIYLNVNDVTEMTMKRHNTLLEKLRIYIEEKENNE